MRITPELLLKIARDTVSQRVKSNRDILAVYLHGSLLQDKPLLGGTTDIDLFLIHTDEPPMPREIVRLTDDVHLDIAHHSRSLYRNTRALRLHPWLGTTLYNCTILHDPQHFLDFTQASVRGQFDQPENILVRVRRQAEQARQTWLAFQMEQVEPGLQEIQGYLGAVEQAANAVACLSGGPLPERRLLLEFPSKAEAAGQAGLYHGLIGLLGGSESSHSSMKDWVSQWEAAYQALPAADAPARLHPHRLPYYLRHFEELLGSDHPRDTLWPLLHNWTLTIEHLPSSSPHRQAWQQALTTLSIYGEAFHERIDALDAYLDTIEEIIENWAYQHGAN